ncbi:hypothetical protein GOBAR_DD22888 [Gossypium barbadense]|nr:hypothetical protein GOBAR_DD22888 [Gossypium barbadense]
MDGQGNGKEVKLLGTWFSPYVQRVVWVLKLKGIDYEWVEQGFRDPKNRSQLLLKYNPVMKTVPVLVHHGKDASITKILSKLLSSMDKKQMEEEMKQGLLTLPLSIITYWMEATEEVLGINIFDSQNYPFIAQWKTNLLEFIQQCLPPKHRLLRFYRKYRQSKL